MQLFFFFIMIMDTISPNLEKISVISSSAQFLGNPPRNISKSLVFPTETKPSGGNEGSSSPFCTSQWALNWQATPSLSLSPCVPSSPDFSCSTSDSAFMSGVYMEKGEHF